jgi:hypothetical protein
VGYVNIAMGWVKGSSWSRMRSGSTVRGQDGVIERCADPSPASTGRRNSDRAIVIVQIGKGKKE